MKYDVIVIGARCAGSPTAMLLARKGYRVLLVDKASVPAESLPVSCYVQQSGIARLARWGLLDALIATGCPPIDRFVVDIGPFRLAGTQPTVSGQTSAYGPRRSALEQVLLTAAAQAGAEVRLGFAVREILVDDDRVAGIRGRARGGTTVSERAQIVIGADGLRSLVVRSVQATRYEAKPPATCAFHSLWSGVPVTAAEFHLHGGHAFSAWPTGEGLTSVVVHLPHRDLASVGANVEGASSSALTLTPTLADRVRCGSREGPFTAQGDVPSFFRKPFGLGWALVGDAGHHKDPILAQGIADAFRDAELLSEWVDAALSERMALDEALAEFERCRNEAAMPMHRRIQLLARLDPSEPELASWFTTSRSGPERAEHFWGTVNGAVVPSEPRSTEAAGHAVPEHLIQCA